jgi:hypothetical protein
VSAHYHELEDGQGDLVELVTFCSDGCHRSWCVDRMVDGTDIHYGGWNGCHELEFQEPCAQCGRVIPGVELDPEGDLLVTPNRAFQHAAWPMGKLNPGREYDAVVAVNQPDHDKLGLVFLQCDSSGDPCIQGECHDGDGFDRWSSVASRSEWEEWIDTTYHDGCPGFLLGAGEYSVVEA